MAWSVAGTVSRFMRSRSVRIGAALALVVSVVGLAALRYARAEPVSRTYLPYYNRPDFTAEWLVPGSRGAAAAHRLAPFRLVDQDGRVVSNETLRGTVHVANFFFSTCHAICPRMVTTLKRIERAFAADPNVLIVSYTVAPSSDTVERLHAYGEAMGIPSDRWKLVTGDRATIYRLARRSYFAEKTLGTTRTNGEFLHTENMLLVDREGHLRGVYNATLPVEAGRVIEDVRRLERER